jgi:hypothetical protein
MAARGVAEMTSKISKEEEEDEASLWQEKSPVAKNSRGGSSKIAELVEALRRENAWGVNEV